MLIFIFQLFSAVYLNYVGSIAANVMIKNSRCIDQFIDMCQIEDVDSASSLTLGYWFTILFPTHLYVHANQLFFIYKLQYFVWIMLIICVIFQLIFRSKLVKYTSRMIAVTSLPHFIAFIILESTEWMQSKPSGTQKEKVPQATCGFKVKHWRSVLSQKKQKPLDIAYFDENLQNQELDMDFLQKFSAINLYQLGLNYIPDKPSGYAFQYCITEDLQINAQRYNALVGDYRYYYLKTSQLVEKLQRQSKEIELLISNNQEALQLQENLEYISKERGIQIEQLKQALVKEKRNNKQDGVQDKGSTIWNVFSFIKGREEKGVNQNAQSQEKDMREDLAGHPLIEEEEKQETEAQKKKRSLSNEEEEIISPSGSYEGGQEDIAFNPYLKLIAYDHQAFLKANQAFSPSNSDPNL